MHSYTLDMQILWNSHSNEQHTLRCCCYFVLRVVSIALAVEYVMVSTCIHKFIHISQPEKEKQKLDDSKLCSMRQAKNFRNAKTRCWYMAVTV